MISVLTIQNIGSRLAELPSDLREPLATLIGAGIEGLDYMAEDLDYRADFERRHDGSEEEEYSDESDNSSDMSSQLSQLLNYLRN